MFSVAHECDALEIAQIRGAAAEYLTDVHGRGPWSRIVGERSVLVGMRHSRVLVARIGDSIIATCRMSTRKPWAIDVSRFAAVRKPLYLTDMAVSPAFQCKGAGRALLQVATTEALNWPSDAIRLDAYDAKAGAGEFYRKCGFTDVGRKVYREVPLVYYELILKPQENS